MKKYSVPIVFTRVCYHSGFIVVMELIQIVRIFKGTYKYGLNATKQFIIYVSVSIQSA